MSEITLKGNKINTIGNLPGVGSSAPEFKLVAKDLSVKTLADYKGIRLVLNIFPSLDTGTCAASVRRFNQEANDLENTRVLCISKDLPFAQARFCGAEGLDNVITLSDFRTGAFGKAYGVEIIDSPMAGLESRAVVIVDEEGNVIYTQQVPEIVDEPDYEKALAILK
ncbi:MAG: thiol peroxidase [Bacteroidales bacterium]|jgi:thiol peroxidase|nr:thiol peroxidase [Bacteroidales bacterium]